MTPIPWDAVPCIGHADLFFAADDDTPGAAQARNNKAKRICRRCPNRQPCLDLALTRHERGVWGGTTENERADMQPRPEHGVSGDLAARFLAEMGAA